MDWYAWLKLAHVVSAVIAVGSRSFLAAMVGYTARLTDDGLRRQVLPILAQGRRSVMLPAGGLMLLTGALLTWGPQSVWHPTTLTGHWVLAALFLFLVAEVVPAPFYRRSLASLMAPVESLVQATAAWTTLYRSTMAIVLLDLLILSLMVLKPVF